MKITPAARTGLASRPKPNPMRDAAEAMVSSPGQWFEVDDYIQAPALGVARLSDAPKELLADLGSLGLGLEMRGGQHYESEIEDGKLFARYVDRPASQPDSRA